MSKITVLLAEDHYVVREGLHMVLNAEKDIEVIGEVSTGREAVRMFQKLRPDILVMDIAMPLLNGLEALRKILKVSPGAKVIMLSAHSDDAYIDETVAMGARGYIIKQSSAEVFARGVREVHKGNVFFSPVLHKRLHDRNRKTFNDKGRITKQITRLSSREAEVLQLIVEGKANKEISSELEISIKTVEKHRQNLMEKLHIHDTAGLTRYAISSGVIESSIQPTTR